MTFFTPRGSVIQLNRVLEFPYVLEGNPILPRKSFSGSAEAGRSGGRAGVRFCKDTRPNDGASSFSPPPQLRKLADDDSRALPLGPQHAEAGA
jgi:hypothetical protein